MSEDCQVSGEEINALVDDELCGREQRRVAAHISTCRRCSCTTGGTLAAKRLLGARSMPVDPPPALWPRVASALDQADGVAQASKASSQAARPARRLTGVPALAGVGLVLIAGALAWRTWAFEPSRRAAPFLHAHAEMLAASSGNVGNGLGNAVSVGRPGSTTWEPLGSELQPFDGAFVAHTLYRVQRMLVSEFIVSSQSFSSSGLSRDEYDGVGYLVAEDRGVSLVAWESRGITSVLVGRVGRGEMLSLASVRRAQAPLMDSL